MKGVLYLLFFIKILFVQKFENLERFSAQEAAEELHFTKVTNSKKEVSWGKVVRKLLFWKNQTKGGALMQQNLPKCDELGLWLIRRTKLRVSNTLPGLF